MPRLHPSVAAARLAVRGTLQRLTPDGPIVVACSGGADSLALAAATAFEAPRATTPRSAVAVIVDHGWAQGSREVAHQAANVCRSLGLDDAIVRVVDSQPDDTGGPEAEAREGRYRVLGRVAEELGAVAVLLGHTLDDQAETVLLRLARGSGIRSIAGMRAQRGLFHRPFLGLRRADTEQICSELGLAPWQDPANNNDAYTRVKVRRDVVPALRKALGPGVDEALARTAGLAAMDADYLDELASREAVNILVSSDNGVSVSVDALAPLPPSLLTRVVHLAIGECGAPSSRVTFTHISAVCDLVGAWTGQGAIDLPGGYSARRVGENLVFSATMAT